MTDVVYDTAVISGAVVFDLAGGSGGGGGGGTFTITPSVIASGSTRTLALHGLGTSWLSSSPTFTVSAGATKLGQNITSDNLATISVLAGGGSATVTVSDGVSSATFEVFVVGTLGSGPPTDMISDAQFALWVKRGY
jgi:hypothetical protein